MSTPALLSVRDLKVHFPVRRGVFQRRVGAVKAVDGVSFDMGPGETLGLVGESGSGKSTVGRAILGLLPPTSGSVSFEGRDRADLSPRELREERRRGQMIFQDPYASLHPRARVGWIVREPLDIHGVGDKASREARVIELLARVGLEPSDVNRYPHEFSGGQRQRIGIARALAASPRFVVADEPVSALDVSVQAQVVNLLVDLKSDLGLTYLFIAHDLALVRHISDRIAVMYLGRIVEEAERDELFEAPLHPYTRLLLASVPIPDPGVAARSAAMGDVPDPADPPRGCSFHPRCPFATERCRGEDPRLRAMADTGGKRLVACHHAEDLV